MIEIPVKKSLSIQMLIAVFVISAFCIIMGIMSYRGFKREFRLNVENNLNAISNLKVGEIVQWRKERICDCSVFFGNQIFSDLVSRFIASPTNPELFDRLVKWLEQVRSAYTYEHILLLDTKGNELIPDPLSSTPISSRLLNDINLVAKTQKVTFLDFHRDVPDGPIRLGVLVPVQSPGDPGKIIAVMVFVINPDDYLYPLIDTWPTLSWTAETLLLRREGDSVLFLNELKFQKNTALNLRFSLNKTSLPAAKAASGNEGIFTGIDYRGVPVISSLRKIPDSPWFMVARMDVKEVHAPLNERWWTMFTVVVLFILSIASLVYTLWFRQRKQAETAAHESEERYRSLYNDAPAGLYRTNSKGEILLANHALIKLLGFQSFDELTAINLNESSVGTSYQRQKFIDKIEKEGEVKNLEAIWICRDGREIFVRENAKLIRDPEGKILYYDGTVEDITEQKKTTEALVESERKFRELITRSPDGIFIVDLSGKFLSGNRAICDSLKCTEEELLSMKIWDIVPEGYQSLHKQRLAAIMNGESTNASAEYEVKGKDGNTHCIEVLSVPYYKGNEIVGFQGIARDITDRKQAEEALRQSEEKYRGIFENVQDLFYETSIEGTILEVSPSIKILSKGQYHRDELIGKSIFDFYSDLNERAALISKLMEQGSVSDFEITLINRDGSRIPCSLSSKIFLDVQGHPEKIIGSARDITDRKNTADAMKLAKENAEASDKLKTSFLNNISHEVRTPLNGILGFAELMSQSDLSEEEKNDSISMLHESCDRLLDTITDYMDISLITSGNISVNKKDFIPAQVLRKIFDNYKTSCSDRKLELLLEIPEQTDNLSINSDPELFRKIISHLLNNAIKFTEKGSIHYGYVIREGEIEFFVKDTGIGIGKESVDNIFDNFVKEVLSPYRLTEGSGLGLSIAKGMVEIIGGNIRVESEIGVGSCFFFTIPLLKDNKTVLSGTSGMEHKKIISGALILVAEDEETNFFYLNALLTRETGATVLHASNGREAIELFIANPGIILILMDIKMPEVDGLEATRQIKLINQDVPIIAITAYAMSGDEERVLAAGFDGFISKPISKKILLEKMEEFIKI